MFSRLPFSVPWRSFGTLAENVMRCVKCHRNKASIHFTPVISGRAQKTVHLCKDCASARTGTRSQTFTPKKSEVLPAKGKRCSFCRRPALYGEIFTGRARYWCADCAVELRNIFLEIAASERHPRLMERVEGAFAFMVRDDPEAHAWWVGAGLRATKIFVDRRKTFVSNWRWLNLRNRQ